MKNKRMILIAGCLLLFAVKSSAQTPTITLLRNMSLGMVISGTSNTIAPSDPGAAEIEVQFPGHSGYGYDRITFNLPAALISGGYSLPVSFGTNSAAWNTTNSFSGSTVFDPSSGYQTLTGSNAPLTLYIWIGGTVSPGNNQASGDYTGTINVDAMVWTFYPFNQFQTSQDISLSSSVIQGLTLMSTGTLDFGLIVAGTTPPSLSPQSGSAPEITAAGSGGKHITVTYSATTSLDDSHGNTLTFTPSVSGTDIPTNQAGATAISSGQRVRLSGNRQSTGYYYFWLGGSLDPVPPNQAPGNYSGTFTLTVNY